MNSKIERKTWRFIALLILSGCLACLSLFYLKNISYAGTRNDIPYEGTAGQCSQSYDADTRELTITGSGSAIYEASDDSDEGLEPIFPECKKVVIGEGVTEIQLSLTGFENLIEVDYPSTLKKVNNPDYTFTPNNYKLRKIVNNSDISIPLSMSYQSGNDGRQMFYWDKYSYDEFQKKTTFSPLLWKTENGASVTECPAHTTVNASPKKYTIKYNLNGGSKGKKSNWYYSYTYGTKKKLPIPVRRGYYFAGWENVNKSKYNTESAFSKVMPWRSGNVSLKAVWRKVKVSKGNNSITINLAPVQYPNATVLISTESDPAKALMTPQSSEGSQQSDVMHFYLNDKGSKSVKNGMYRVITLKNNHTYYNLRNLNVKLQKGTTYYIWIKTGELQSWEYGYPDESSIYKQSTENDIYYFYKTKIKF